jgi:hypothetical protein
LARRNCKVRDSPITITMDIYSHLMTNMQADAAAKLDATLRGCGDDPSKKIPQMVAKWQQIGF